MDLACHAAPNSTDDLLLIRFAVPATLARPAGPDRFQVLCAGISVEVPSSQLTARSASHYLFEARLPHALAAAVRSSHGELVALRRPQRRSTSRYVARMA